MPTTKMPRNVRKPKKGGCAAFDLRVGDPIYYGSQPFEADFERTPERDALTEAILIALRSWRISDGRRVSVKLPPGPQHGILGADMSALVGCDGNPVQLAECVERTLADMGWQMTLTRPKTKRRKLWIQRR